MGFWWWGVGGNASFWEKALPALTVVSGLWLGGSSAQHIAMHHTASARKALGGWWFSMLALYMPLCRIYVIGESAMRRHQLTPLTQCMNPVVGRHLSVHNHDTPFNGRLCYWGVKLAGMSVIGNFLVFSFSEVGLNVCL